MQVIGPLLTRRTGDRGAPGVREVLFHHPVPVSHQIGPKLCTCPNFRVEEWAKRVSQKGKTVASAADGTSPMIIAVVELPIPDLLIAHPLADAITSDLAR